jgi:histone H3/H4
MPSRSIKRKSDENFISRNAVHAIARQVGVPALSLNTAVILKKRAHGVQKVTDAKGNTKTVPTRGESGYEVVTEAMDEWMKRVLLKAEACADADGVKTIKCRHMREALDSVVYRVC